MIILIKMFVKDVAMCQKRKTPKSKNLNVVKKIENYSQAINIKPSKHLGKGESQADRRAKQANKKQADK